MIGAGLYPILAKRVGLSAALKIILVLFATLDAVFPLVCNSPDDAGLAWIFGALIGIVMGLMFPAQRTMFYNIIPAGREAEMTGVYMFCLYVFGFLPTYIFYQVNEATNNLQYGFSALVIMYIIGLSILVFGGFDYERAKKKMESTLGNRYYVGADGEVNKGGADAGAGAGAGADGDGDNGAGVELGAPAGAPLGSGAAIVPTNEQVVVLGA